MIKIYIDNEEVVCNNLIEIKEDMLSTSSTILNNCYPKSWETNKDYVSNFYYPKDYSQCLIYKDDDLIFSGIVKNTGNISLNPREPKFCSLQILDYKTFLSEGILLDFVISNKTIMEAIQMVVDEVSDYGFVLGDVNIYNSTDIIGAYNTQNKSAYDVFQYLADISSAKWYTKTIDENTIEINFYDPDYMIQGNNIEYNTSYFEENGIEDISFSYTTNDYRNRQSILSNQVYGSIDYTENMLASGYTREFLTTTNIGEIKSIKVNGVEATFGTDEDKEFGLDYDFYYKIGDNRFSSNGDNPIYSVGTQITVIYTPLIQGRQVVSNMSEITRINQNTGRYGVIERYENRNDVLSNDELLNVAQTYIKYKGSPEVILKVKSYKDLNEQIGTKVYFDAPILELAKWYMIKSKTTKIYSAGSNTYEVFYEYEMSSSFNAEKDVNWFDNQRNKRTGNIKLGQYITRNIDIDETATIIWQDLQAEEITVTDDNVLNAPLNAPLIK
jgi:hypothetical protein